MVQIKPIEDGTDCFILLHSIGLDVCHLQRAILPQKKKIKKKEVWHICHIIFPYWEWTVSEHQKVKICFSLTLCHINHKKIRLHILLWSIWAALLPCLESPPLSDRETELCVVHDAGIGVHHPAAPRAHPALLSPGTCHPVPRALPAEEPHSQMRGTAAAKERMVRQRARFKFI